MLTRQRAHLIAIGSVLDNVKGARVAADQNVLTNADIHHDNIEDPATNRHPSDIVPHPEKRV
jgi:hypothetical protein